MKEFVQEIKQLLDKARDISSIRKQSLCSEKITKNDQTPFALEFLIHLLEWMAKGRQLFSILLIVHYIPNNIQLTAQIHTL